MRPVLYCFAICLALAIPASATAAPHATWTKGHVPATPDRLVNIANHSALPYLSAGEAARVVGRVLNQKFDNLAQGSLDARCPATGRPNFRRCSYTYFDDGGTCWWGDMAVRENQRSYAYRLLYDARCH